MLARLEFVRELAVFSVTRFCSVCDLFIVGDDLSWMSSWLLLMEVKST